jgi:hypothetical protein
VEVVHSEVSVSQDEEGFDEPDPELDPELDDEPEEPDELVDDSEELFFASPPPDSFDPDPLSLDPLEPDPESESLGVPPPALPDDPPRLSVR